MPLESLIKTPGKLKRKYLEKKASPQFNMPKKADLQNSKTELQEKTVFNVDLEKYIKMNKSIPKK